MTDPVLSHEQLMRHLETMAGKAIGFYPLDPSSQVTLINQSENSTYRVQEPGTGRVTILRLHREDYHTTHAIACELAWMEALRRTAGLITPTPIPGRNGDLIHSVAIRQLPRPRNCVLFEFLRGSEPDESALLGSFGTLGQITARIHNHATEWQRPDRFERLNWDFDHLIGRTPYWGRWSDAPGLDAERTSHLQQMVQTLEARLSRYGQGPDRFGLIHADLRLANLLVEGEMTKVIDFDDCGSGWFLYDLATALSFMEDRPDVPALVDAWVAGYTRKRPMSRVDRAEIPTFLMLRRMAILAWIGSHAQTDLAGELGPSYTEATCQLADRYLRENA